MNAINLGRVVGLSAYELAVKQGYKGTLNEWIESLKYKNSEEFQTLERNILNAMDRFAEENGKLDATAEQVAELARKSLSDINTEKENAIAQVRESASDVEDKVNNLGNDIDLQLASALGEISDAGSAWKQYIDSEKVLSKQEIENATEQAAVESAKRAGEKIAEKTEEQLARIPEVERLSESIMDTYKRLRIIDKGKFLVDDFGEIVETFSESTITPLYGSNALYADSDDYSRFRTTSLKITKGSDARSKNLIVGINNFKPIENMKYGIWFYVPNEEYDKLSQFNINFGQNKSGYMKVGAITISVFRPNMVKGWNYCEFDLYDPNNADVEYSAIRIQIQDEKTSAFNEISIYFDTMCMGYRMRPTILFAFDNCNDNNMYDVAYKMMVDKSLYGTFAYQNGANPDGVGVGKNFGITREHLNQMLIDGWDVAQYDSTSITEHGQDPVYIREFNALLKSQGVNLTAYFPRFNDLNEEIYETVKDLGFKITRMSAGYRFIEGQDMEAVPCWGFNFVNDFNATKSIIDEAVENGKGLCLLIHSVVDENDGTDSNCLRTEFQKLIDYVADLRNRHIIQLMTFKELYESRFNDAYVM